MNTVLTSVAASTATSGTGLTSPAPGSMAPASTGLTAGGTGAALTSSAQDSPGLTNTGRASTALTSAGPGPTELSSITPDRLQLKFQSHLLLGTGLSLLPGRAGVPAQVGRAEDEHATHNGQTHNE
jgi:hypothetical protein